MLVPSRNTRNMINSLMTEPFEMFLDGASSIPKPLPTLMKTDIKETDTGLEFKVDLPGVNKEDVTVELKDGYLTICATAKGEKEEKSDDGTYLRRERFSGKSSRDFYVGEEIKEEAIKAKFDNGVLQIDVPKMEKIEPEEKKKVITIEG